MVTLLLLYGNLLLLTAGTFARGINRYSGLKMGGRRCTLELDENRCVGAGGNGGGSG
jgi:hypothetical protein